MIISWSNKLTTISGGFILIKLMFPLIIISLICNTSTNVGLLVWSLTLVFTDWLSIEILTYASDKPE